MRRLDFLRVGGLLGLGGVLSSFTRPTEAASLDEVLATKIKTAGLTGSAFDLSVAPISRVRVAVFGLGNRGQSLIDMLNWLVQEGHAEITAISDINPAKIGRAQQQIAEFQQSAPRVFTGTPDAWMEAMSDDVADVALIC
ncbi:MAG: hypothetical protein ACPHM0_01935, partial [Flavobacteriales bacterium]